MARPPKEGIDYSEWDVDIMDDPKIDTLMEGTGCQGFVVFFYLCQRIYASHGYYMNWESKYASTVARRVGCGVTANMVARTIETCLAEGLFDQGLFDRYSILTSRGIQKRFTRVIPKRNNKKVFQEYWLLSSDKSAGAVLIPKE